VETTGGNRVTGVLAVETLKIKSDELGELEIKPEAVRSVGFDHGGDTIVTKSDAMIKGTIALKELKIQSEFGTLTIPREKLKAITAIQRGGPGFTAHELPRVAGSGPAPGGDEPRPALPNRGGDGGQPDPPTERPSRPSPIPGRLLPPGPGSGGAGFR
jgi:hypothetical protein